MMIYIEQRDRENISSIYVLMLLRNNKTIITHNIKNNKIKYSKNAINGGELLFRFAVSNMGDLYAVKNQLANVEDRLNELLQLHDRLPNNGT